MSHSSSSSYLLDDTSDGADTSASPDSIKRTTERSPGYDSIQKGASTPRTTNVSHSDGSIHSKSNSKIRHQRHTLQRSEASPAPTSLASSGRSSSVVLVEGIATDHCLQPPPIHSNKAIVVSNGTTGNSNSNSVTASPSVTVVPFYERWNQDFASIKSALDEQLQSMVEVSQHEMDLLSAAVSPRTTTRAASILSSLEQPRPEPKAARIGIEPMMRQYHKGDNTTKVLSPWYEKSRLPLPTDRVPMALTPPSMLAPTDETEASTTSSLQLQRTTGGGLVSSPTMNTTSPSCRSGRTNKSDTTEPQSNMTQHVQERRQRQIEQRQQRNEMRMKSPPLTHHLMYHHQQRSGSSWSSGAVAAADAVAGGGIHRYAVEDATQIRHSQSSMDFAIPEEEQTNESNTVATSSVGRVTPSSDYAPAASSNNTEVSDDHDIAQQNLKNPIRVTQRSEDDDKHEIFIITSQDEAVILAAEEKTRLPSPSPPPPPERFFFPDNLDESDSIYDDETQGKEEASDLIRHVEATDDENEAERDDCLSPLVSTVPSTSLTRPVLTNSGDANSSVSAEEKRTTVPSQSRVSRTVDNNDATGMVVSPSSEHSSTSASSWAMKLNVQSPTNLVLTTSTPSSTTSALTLSPSLLTQSRTRSRKSSMYRFFDARSERRQGWKYPSLLENAQKKIRDAPQLRRVSGNSNREHRRYLFAISFDRPDAPEGSTCSDVGERQEKDAPTGSRSVGSNQTPKLLVPSPATPTPVIAKAPSRLASSVTASKHVSPASNMESYMDGNALDNKLSHAEATVAALSDEAHPKTIRSTDNVAPSREQSLVSDVLPGVTRIPVGEQENVAGRSNETGNSLSKEPDIQENAATRHNVTGSIPLKRLEALLANSSTGSIGSNLPDKSHESSTKQDSASSTSHVADAALIPMSSGSDGEWQASSQEISKGDESDTLPRVENGTEHVTNKIIADPYGDQGSFTGVIIHGKPGSYGTMMYQDGRIFSGSWKRGKWDGHGQVIFANGDTYTGDYVRDQRHGVGRYEWSDGRVYDGRFERDQRHGHGIYSWPDGSLYSGDFHNGVRHGLGTFTYPDGSVYSGTWRDGKQNGHGECVWADGRCFRGDWIDGHTRFGVEVRADGTIRHNGVWKDDRPVRNKSKPKKGDLRTNPSVRRDKETLEALGNSLVKGEMSAKLKGEDRKTDTVDEITGTFQTPNRQKDRIGQQVSYNHLKNLVSSSISHSASELGNAVDSAHNVTPTAETSTLHVQQGISTSGDNSSSERHTISTDDPSKRAKTNEIYPTTISKKSRISSQHRDRTTKLRSDPKAAWLDAKETHTKISKHAHVSKTSRATLYTNQLLHTTSQGRPEPSIALLLDADSRESSDGDIDSGVLEENDSTEFDFCRRSFKPSKKSSRLLRYQLKMRYADCR